LRRYTLRRHANWEGGHRNALFADCDYRRDAPQATGLIVSLAARSLNVESRKARLAHERASLCGSYLTVTRLLLKTSTAQVSLKNLYVKRAAYYSNAMTESSKKSRAIRREAGEIQKRTDAASKKLAASPSRWRPCAVARMMAFVARAG